MVFLARTIKQQTKKITQRQPLFHTRHFAHNNYFLKFCFWYSLGLLNLRSFVLCAWNHTRIWTASIWNLRREQDLRIGICLSAVVFAFLFDWCSFVSAMFICSSICSIICIFSWLNAQKMWAWGYRFWAYTGVKKYFLRYLYMN